MKKEKDGNGRKGGRNLPVEGVISVNDKGFGFVDCDGFSVFVPPGKLRGAISGDTVSVSILPDSDPSRPSGMVQRILQRKYSQVVGCIVPWHDGWALRPLRHELPPLLPLDAHSCEVAVPPPVEGNWAVAQLPIPEDPDGAGPGYAVLLDVLGHSGNVTCDLNAIASEFGLPEQYSEADEARAHELKAVHTARLNCTRLTAVTIDPVDARDYDDALSCEIDRKSGDWVVGVHIADVACYVRNGSWLDKEARRRGFTSYLPGRTIPMLPRALANDQCSLRAGVERLAHSVFITIDPSNGQIKGWKRRHTAINVTQRLCYDQVQLFLDGGDFDGADEVRDLVTRLHHLSQLLRRRRFREERFLPMAMPEIRAICSENPPAILGVQGSVDNPSHQLVEEFMLAANECIARELLQRHLPGLFRNHQAPDEEKMAEFSHQAEEMTHQPVKELNSRARIVDFLRKAAQSPIRDVLYMAFLRNLPRADYGVESLGHFGLGKEYYCHFTSPIRRYADLLVHQQLLSMDNHRRHYGVDAVAQVAAECCEREYACDSAEFAAEDRMKIRYIDSLRGEHPDFTVSGRVCKAGKAGLGVYLPEYGLMAFISAMTLPKSWHFDAEHFVWVDQHQGTRLGVTAPVTCQVVAAEPVRGELLLLPAGLPLPPPEVAQAAATGVSVAMAVVMGAKSADHGELSSRRKGERGEVRHRSGKGERAEVRRRREAAAGGDGFSARERGGRKRRK